MAEVESKEMRKRREEGRGERRRTIQLPCLGWSGLCGLTFQTRGGLTHGLKCRKVVLQALHHQGRVSVWALHSM